MRTRLTDMLDIELPVMLAGMGGVSYAELVAAVSEAGGIGTLGASTMSSEQLAGEMAHVRRLTDKPFGVDLLTAAPGAVEASISLVADGGARIYVAGLGVPRDVVDMLHSKGILVGSMCGKVRHAVAAAASGCDFVVAQGTEAGGHTGTVATMALVPQVVDAVGDKIPVVAAGGIFDGRGLVATLALGGPAESGFVGSGTLTLQGEGLFSGTMAVFFTVVNASKWLPYTLLGLIDLRNMATALELMPLAPLGVWIGVRLTHRVSATWFYRLAYTGMGLTGMKLLWDGIM
jgi:isopentenyl diphosphate isomerase/L-lactate dehydrogenase-like FMN-dependent dehydrogenase